MSPQEIELHRGEILAFVAGRLSTRCIARVSLLEVTVQNGTLKVRYEWEGFSDGEELGEIDTDVLYIAPANLRGDLKA